MAEMNNEQIADGLKRFMDAAAQYMGDDYPFVLAAEARLRAPAAPPEGWISVNDRLPPEGEWYAVMLADPDDVGWATDCWWRAYFNNGGYWDSCEAIEDGQPVTHWFSFAPTPSGVSAPAAGVPGVIEGWKWMTHPTRLDGRPIPVRFFNDDDGAVLYQPFNPSGTYFYWDERSDEWQEAAAAPAANAQPSELPPLPEPEATIRDFGPAWQESHMRDYGLACARAALAHAQSDAKPTYKELSSEINDALCDFMRHWKVDGDYLRCKKCNRPMIASRTNELEFVHADGCKAAGKVDSRPWRALAEMLRPLLAQSDSAGDARDAARYRWLRDHCGMRYKPANGRAYRTAEESDDAIDAAIAASAAKGGA